ncbi:MAG: ribose 5-phosphate isomerase B [Oscillospiraceae bacterium]|jgi:ribose 5-phosphate isomerase B|nr:ribose 5-phosphate isomerase B [Oscillospiraceae bacterium]
MIALACDHGGFAYMRELKLHLDGRDVAYEDFGTHSGDSCDYPEFAERAARAVASGVCSAGILICGTGIGMSIAANKLSGIRAALCSDCFSAEMTRRHNDANILALGARVIGVGLMLKIVDVFLDTGFDGGRHLKRVEMIRELERITNCQDTCRTPTGTAARPE